MYQIKDNKVGFNAPIFFAPNHGAAIRTFAQTVRNGEGLLKDNPSDFDLYYLGEQDDEKGQIASDVKFLDSAKNYCENNSEK